MLVRLFQFDVVNTNVVSQHLLKVTTYKSLPLCDFNVESILFPVSDFFFCKSNFLFLLAVCFSLSLFFFFNSQLNFKSFSLTTPKDLLFLIAFRIPFMFKTCRGCCSCCSSNYTKTHLPF